MIKMDPTGFDELGKGLSDIISSLRKLNNMQGKEIIKESTPVTGNKIMYNPTTLANTPEGARRNARLNNTLLKKGMNETETPAHELSEAEKNLAIDMMKKFVTDELTQR